MAATEVEASAYSVSTVERAIDVLETFSPQAPELGLVEIAARTGLHKTTAFRLLATLCRRGLVSKHAVTGLYRLGFGLIPFAEIAKAPSGLVAEALPVMRHARDVLNETVFLSVRVGDHRVDIEQVEGLQDVRRVLRLGEQKPLYAGAASKVLLAAMPDGEIADYLARARLVAYTPTTIVAPEALRAEITRIRRQGLAEGWDERNSGGAGAAAPIYGAADTVVGAVAVAVPTGRYSRELKKRTVAMVAEAAVEISAAIGARPGRLLRSRGRRGGR